MGSSGQKREKMNTIFDIFSRDDYSKATQKLRDAVIDVAAAIRSKMEDLDLTEIRGNNHWFAIQKVKANCGYSERYLAYEGRSLEDRNSYYYCNDYNCWVERASNSDVIKFANSVGGILKALDEIESEQTEEAEAKEFFTLYEAWQSYKETEKQAKDFDKNNTTL